MTQLLKQSRWERFFNNVLSHKEAVIWAVALVSAGVAVGYFLWA